VFGSAIDIAGSNYREYLMAGIFTQTVLFGATWTGAGLAQDLQRGIIDRFRSLPMARSAVLTGRSFGDVVYNLGILIVLMLSGLFVGWTVHTGVSGLLAGVALCLLFAFAMSWLGIYLGLHVPTVEVANQVVFTVLFPITFLSSAFVAVETLPEFLAAVGLLLLFTFAMSWIGVWLGLSVPSVEVAQQVSFIVIFPITFVSNAFVPIQTLPAWLQPFAEWNPVSTLTAATRQLFGNPDPYATDNLPSQEPILVTIGWIIVIVGIFAPLGIRKYRQTSK
jgi:ABC-type multidrug transport system permease subunit